MSTAEECAAQGMISEQDFEDVWGVYRRPDGNFFEFREVVNQPVEHVWTVVETGWVGDGNWYACPGFHIVNKIGYVMTKRPWDESVIQAVYFLDDITTLDDLDEEDLANLTEEDLAKFRPLEGI